MLENAKIAALTLVSFPYNCHVLWFGVNLQMMIYTLKASNRGFKLLRNGSFSHFLFLLDFLATDGNHILR